MTKIVEVRGYAGTPETRKTPIGRRLLLTPELEESICEAIEKVRYLSIAAESVGISKHTAMRWMREGNQHEEKFHADGTECDSLCGANEAAFRRFFNAIKRSRAKFTVEAMKRIESHGQANWQADAWRLERTDPEHFAIKGRVEHTGKDGGPIIHKLLSPEQKQRMLGELQQTIDMTETDEGVFTPDYD